MAELKGRAVGCQVVNDCQGLTCVLWPAAATHWICLQSWGLASWKLQGVSVFTLPVLCLDVAALLRHPDLMVMWQGCWKGRERWVLHMNYRKLILDQLYDKWKKSLLQETGFSWEVPERLCSAGVKGTSCLSSRPSSWTQLWDLGQVPLFLSLYFTPINGNSNNSAKLMVTDDVCVFAIDYVPGV
jgi:hypothetical protein